MDDYHFGNDELTIVVKTQGAELASLAHVRLGEMLWQALPAWPAHAPNLFPIVGQLAGDTLRRDGESYHLTRHGFARRMPFTWIDRGPQSCSLVLRDDSETRARYPYAFALQIRFSLEGEALTVRYTVQNTGSEVLPASVGAHPAFRWPLADGVAKSLHTLEFSDAEPAPIRRLADGLLKREVFPSPIRGRALELDDALFVDDAIVMDRLASRSVRYAAPGAPSIDVGWTGFEHLGLWSKPGAEFLCIEPWYGYASPVGFDGPFASKPGLLLIPPGEEKALTLTIRVIEGRA